MLKNGVQGSTSKPTEVQLRQAGDLKPLVAKLVADVNALIPSAGALVQKLAAAGVLLEIPKPIGTATDTRP